MSNATARPIAREVGRTVRLAGPLIGGQLASVGMTFIDTVIAGRLGAEALASIAIGGSIWASVMLFTTGVLMALPPSIAQLNGAGRRAEAAPLTRQAFWVGQAMVGVALAIAFGVSPALDWLQIQPELVSTILAYLRALCWGMPALAFYLVLRFFSEGLSIARPTLYFGLAGLPLNAVAKYVLMHGHLGAPALGAVGCGYATSIVCWAQALGMALFVSRRTVYRELGLFSSIEPPRMTTIREILRVGLPIGATWLAGVSLFTVAALLIGSMGILEVAGHQVAINFAALTYMVPLGVSMAISVRVGNAVGRRDPAAARLASHVGIAVALSVQTVWATIMTFFPSYVAGMYTRDPAVIERAAELLLLAAIFQFPDGLQVSSAGALRGYKDTRAPMGITLVL